jgi:outer membrane protein TolC
VTQRIPWWSKLWARGRVAGVQADIARLRYEAAARDLIVDVKDTYYELYYLDRATSITQRVEDLLRNESLLAYSELDSGRTQLGEAFRAESQAAQLAYDRILLTEQRAAQAERFRALLNLPPGTTIGSVDSAPLYPVVKTIDPLYERAERYAEVLKIKGLEIQKAEYDAYLAKLERIPDITAGVNYIQTDSARTMDPQDSGKDPFIGLISVNLPIWEQRNRALVREKNAMEEAMKREALEQANRTRRAVAQAWFQVRLTERLAHLYADTLLPQAEAVMHQNEIFFRNDEASFSNLLETTLAWHNFLLAYHRAVADHGQAIGRIELILGTTAEPRQMVNDSDDANADVAFGHTANAETTDQP